VGDAVLMVIVVGEMYPHRVIWVLDAFWGKVCVVEPVFVCPFCDAPAWRSRYVLWWHMHGCICQLKQQEAPLAVRGDVWAEVAAPR
jgi:hypothetical protein